MIVVAAPAALVMVQLSAACVAAVAVLELVLLAVGSDVREVLILVVLAVEYYCFFIIINVGTSCLPDPVWPLQYKRFSRFSTNTASVS